MNPELLHALWLVAVPVAVYGYKMLEGRLASLEHTRGKHAKKLAKNAEKLGAISATLVEIKDGMEKLGGKIDRLAERKDVQ